MAPISQTFKEQSFFTQGLTAARHKVMNGLFNDAAMPRLSNGMAVQIKHVPDSTVENLTIRVKSGALADPEGREGLAHILEHMVFSQNPEIRQAFDRDLRQQGGRALGQTTADMTRYMVNAVTEDGDSTLYARLLAQAVFNPAIDPAQFAQEKNVVLDEINMHRDKVTEDIGNSARHAAYGTSAGANEVLGGPESLAAMTVEDLMDFHRRHYHAGNCVIEYNGPQKPAQVLMMLERFFGHVPPGPAMEQIPLPTPSPQPGGGAHVHPDPNMAQTQYGVAVPLALGQGRAINDVKLIGEYLNLAVHEAMRGDGPRSSYFQMVSWMNFAHSGPALVLRGAGGPGEANRAMTVFAAALRDLSAGRADPEILATARGSLRLQDEEMRQRWLKDDSAAAPPPLNPDRYNITTDALAAYLHDHMGADSPGLAVRGQVEGVMGLDALKKLLPGGDAPGAAPVIPRAAAAL